MADITLFAAPGSCSRVTTIVLEEIGVPFTYELVRFMKGFHKSAAYTSDLEEVDEESWQPTTYKMGPGVVDQWGTGRIIPGNVPHQTQTADKGLWQVPA